MKSLFGLKWMTVFCPSAKYLLKCDDDVIINFPVIVDILESSERTNTIWGPLTINARTQRWGKYWLSWSDYPFFYLPPYTRGSAYVISADIIEPLFNTGEYVPMIPIDDVYVTGILGKILHINLYPKYAEKWGKFNPLPCDIRRNRTIVGILDDGTSLLNMWQKLTEKLQC